QRYFLAVRILSGFGEGAGPFLSIACHIATTGWANVQRGPSDREWPLASSIDSNEPRLKEKELRPLAQLENRIGAAPGVHKGRRHRKPPATTKWTQVRFVIASGRHVPLIPRG